MVKTNYNWQTLQQIQIGKLKFRGIFKLCHIPPPLICITAPWPLKFELFCSPLILDKTELKERGSINSLTENTLTKECLPLLICLQSAHEFARTIFFEYSQVDT